MIWKWAYKELKNQKNYFIFFVINITIGFSSFFNLQILKDSISIHFQERALQGLGADIALSVRRKWTTSENEFIQKFIKSNQLKHSHSYEFFAMAQLDQNTNSDNQGHTVKLVNVKTIDQSYPLYGMLETLKKKALNDGEAFVDQSFKQNFNNNEQNKLILGDIKLTISDLVLDDSTQSFRISGLAPKVYISESNLRNSNLISFGSTFSDTYLFKTNTKDTDVSNLEQQLKNRFQDPTIQIITATSSAEERTNALKYMTDFFSIIGMVSVFLAIVVCYFLVKSYLRRNYLNMAIYNTLGWTKTKIYYFYLAQIIVLISSGFVSMGLFSFITFPMVKNVLLDLAGINVYFASYQQAMILLLLLATLTTLIVSLPFFEKVKNLSIQQIFQDSSSDISTRDNLNLKTYLFSFLLISGFTLVAIWQTHSIKMGTGFTFGLLSAAGVCASLGWLWMRFAEKIVSKFKWIIKYSILGVTRKKSISLVSLICIGCGVMVLHLTQSLQSNLAKEIESPQGLRIPSFFAFDIQEDQIDILKKIVDDNLGELTSLAPMVRGRISKINEIPFASEKSTLKNETVFQTRESESEMRFRNRAVNLSYHSKLSNAEWITAGNFWQNDFDPQQQSIPELSVEESYAKKLSLKMDDVLVFDVQGVEVRGKITSLRKVKWNSFQPNFFIIFQPGVLNTAPKTFISSLQIDPVKNNIFYSSMLKNAANVSIIDVKEMSKKILDLTDQLLFALKLFAVSVSLAGVFIVIVILASYFQTQKKEYYLLHVLGSKSKNISKYILYQVSIILLASGFIGLLLGELFSFIVSNFVFDGIYRFQLHQGLWILAILTIIAFILSKTLYAIFDLRH